MERSAGGPHGPLQEQREAASDREALAEALGGYRPLAVSLARVRLGSTAEAEDVAQEAMERALTQLGRLRRPEALAPWLMRIVVNICNDRLRRRVRGRAAMGKLTPPDGRAAQDAVRARLLEEDRTRILGHAAMRLSAECKETLALRYVEGLKIREVATAQGISATAVEMRLQRSLRKMRAYIQKLGLSWEDLCP